MSGKTGLVSASNSIVGTTAEDEVCWSAVALDNGNYLVISPYWDNNLVINAGAVTWGDGDSGTILPVSDANSLVGSQDYDHVGESATGLLGGNYVVSSSYWDYGLFDDAGAATWENGTNGTQDEVSLSNSLVRTKNNDRVGSFSTIALLDGNYLVLSPLWNDGVSTHVGAATWGDGSSGTTGPVSTGNSLVGTQADDQVGYTATALKNGHYVVGSPYWNNGLVSDAGAATWINGGSSNAAIVSTSNSLVGTLPNDRVSMLGITALSHGNYVVTSPFWDNGLYDDAGAATWGNGAAGITGSITPANSLMGGREYDYVGHYGVIALYNGHYVVPSPDWSDGGIPNAGAVTWGNGSTGIVGLISSANSLVGDSNNDEVGFGPTSALRNGDYASRSPIWDSEEGTTNAGAVTWGSGLGGTIGTITLHNSVIGTATSGGSQMVFTYDLFNRQLVVGRPADNIVTLFRMHSLYVPLAKN